MDGLFWQRLHGGSTHLPLVLLPLSVLFDFVALRLQDPAARRVMQIAAVALAFLGVLGGCAGVMAGLAMTDGTLLGRGEEKWHHVFVWPAFGLSLGLVAWRLSRRGRLSGSSPTVYLIAMSVASVLMLGAGYWGGEMLLHATPENPVTHSGSSRSEPSFVTQGHDLFRKHCVRCHGDDARGTDDGPGLTRFHKSEARIASVVMNGIKGEMPRFGHKLTDDEVKMLIRFILSLNGRAI
jgi:mono/diheme cytochrome c family protein